MHVPVMLPEALEYLAVRPDGFYVDVTLGLAGHSRAIADRLTSGRLLSLDRDAESMELARQNLGPSADRVEFRQARFSELAALGISEADGLIADLGVSKFQLTTADRGFSFMNAGPVDMRMDRSKGTTAGEIVNTVDERTLANLIFEYAEERRSRQIARAIVRARPIRDTAHLAAVIEGAVARSGPIHPATRTFMALRLVVNEELDELDSLLESAPKLLRPGGRFVVITFMSLEDRKVKQSFQELAREGRARILTKHVVRPSDSEVRQNPPSRSAKLRAIEIQEQ
ncbi:MAG TPA: 16S rRNA (cytosine(1402)-N(4))-methyltransferase RsmH [Bryobacteraceae bacterium]|nr:16S rRNA (cytosine(1402)-N(4))-methyltransferase RsmH [Bryobacteraceae bacterium]